MQGDDEKRMREFQPPPAELEKIHQALLTSTHGIDFLLQLLAEAHEEIAKTGIAGANLLPAALPLFWVCRARGGPLLRAAYKAITQTARQVGRDQDKRFGNAGPA